MGEAPGTREWDFDFSRITRVVLISCLVAEGLIFLLDVCQHVAEIWYFENIKDLSNVIMENSFGTWFSVVLNAGAGMVALCVALCCRKTGKPRLKTLAWLLIALFFLYVSLDDHLVLHERLSGGIGRILFKFQLTDKFQFLTYEWIYIFVPFFGLFGVFMLIFLFRELNGFLERMLLLFGLGLWTLAVGLDALEGAGLPYESMEVVAGLARTKIRHSFMLVEEMFELLGSTVFLFLFLRRLRNLLKERPTILRVS
jgi:hypothetical protein